MRRISGTLAALALVFAVACGGGDTEMEETDQGLDTPGMMDGGGAADTTMMAPPMDTMRDTTMMDTMGG